MGGTVHGLVIKQPSWQKGTISELTKARRSLEYGHFYVNLSLDEPTTHSDLYHDASVDWEACNTFVAVVTSLHCA